MQVSQYNSPAQYTPIDTVTPIPFNELMQAGQLKQKDYEQGQQALGQTADAYSNINYIPNSVDEQYVKSVVMPKTQEIVNKYSNLDLTDPVVRRQMMSEFNTGIDKNRLQSIQKSYTGWDQYNKANQQLDLNGKMNPFQQDVSKGWDSSSRGIFNIIPHAYTNPEEIWRQRIFAPVQDSTMFNSGPDAQGNVRIKNGVSLDNVKNLAAANAHRYVGTEEGNNAIQQYIKDHGVDSITGKSDADIIEASMVDAGRSYVRSKDSLEHMEIEKEKKNSKESTPIFTGEFYTPQVKNAARLDSKHLGLTFDLNNIKSVDDLKNVLDNTTGALKLPDKPTVVNAEHDEKYGESQTRSQSLIEQQKIASQTAQYNHLRTLIDVIKKNSPELANASDGQILASYAKAYQKAETTNHSIVLFATNPGASDAQQIVSKQILSNLTNRDIVDPMNQDKGSLKKISWNDYISDKDKFGNNDKLRKESEHSAVINGVIPSLGMYSAFAVGPDGREHAFYVELNNREKRYFTAVKDITDAANNSDFGTKTVKTKDQNGNPIVLKVRTRLVIGSDGTPECSSDVLVGDQAMSLEEFRKRASQALIEANFPQANTTTNAE